MQVLSQCELDATLSYMEENSFSKHYIMVHRIIGNKVIRYQNAEEWQDFSQVSDWFDGQNYSKCYLEDIHAVLANFYYFKSLGRLPEKGLGPVQKQIQDQLSADPDPRWRCRFPHFAEGTGALSFPAHFCQAFFCRHLCHEVITPQF